MSNRISVLAVLVLIYGGGALLAQQPTTPLVPAKPATPDKMSLEELLAAALKDHPDLRVAEAKIREAEAELSRARILVAQKVITLHGSVTSARLAVEEATRRMEQMRKLAPNKLISVEELMLAETAVLQKRADLARLEAELPLLLGQAPGDKGNRETLRIDYLQNLKGAYELTLVKERPVTGSVADKLRKSLDTSIPIKFEETTVSEMLDHFNDRLEIAFLVLLTKDQKTQKVTLSFAKPLPAGAALQAISDATGLKFGVREYGVVVTKGELPEGAVPLTMFWKNAPAEKSTTPEKKP
jgi:hypothetical protein